MNEEIFLVLKSHPELACWIDDKFSAKRLGGLTNHNFLLEKGSTQYVLRIPGQGTHEYIHRGNEKQAAELTSQLGVNVPLYYFDENTGVQLSQFIGSAKTMNAKAFKDQGSISRAAKSLRRVHTSKDVFLSRFELFSMMDKYLDFLKTKKAPLPQGFMEIKKQAESIKETLNRTLLPIAPCHCDPLAENFLDTGDTMYVIDWEYSGKNDPMWDLADLSVEAAFNEEQDEFLLTEYFDGKVYSYDRGRIKLYKAMVDLLWTLWGVIQHVNNNPSEDFWLYSTHRFDRCKNLIETTSFKNYLRDVEDGARRSETH